MDMQRKTKNAFRDSVTPFYIYFGKSDLHFCVHMYVRIYFGSIYFHYILPGFASVYVCVDIHVYMCVYVYIFKSHFIYLLLNM